MDDERMMVFGPENGPGEDLYAAVSSCTCALIDHWGPEDDMNFEQRNQLKVLEHWAYAIIMANHGWSGPLTDAGLFNLLLAAEAVREIDAALNSLLLIACTTYHYARERGDLNVSK